MEIVPRNMKGRSLGERPAFLRSPPGGGVSKPWGVWEGGFDERLGGPPAGYVDLSGVGRAWDVGSAANFVKSLSDMNYKEVRPSLMEAT